jgi:EpsI family protein
MRTIRPARFVTLCVLLALAALLVGLRSERGAAPVAKKPLQQMFAQLGPWHGDKDIPMDGKIVEALNLDDYLFRSYLRSRGDVTVYIGYYRSAKKVGAAHDPLICFQGQGWKINSRDGGTLALVRHPGLNISYSSMLAERQDERQVVVYWFQANAKANANTQSQKVTMVLDRIAGRNEDNAFVRLSAPVGNETPEAVRQRIFDFVEDFYPEFLDYVTRT